MLANGQLLSSELAARAQLDRALTSRAITSLVAKKLVLRVPQPGDRRRAVLSLSDEGRATYEGMFRQVAQINSSLLSAISPQAVDALDEQLRLLQIQSDQMVAQSALPRTDRWRGGRTPRSLA